MSRTATAWTAFVATAALYAGTVLAIHAANPRTLVSLHGLLHAAIVQHCMVGLPPENPFFAGAPICYYWFFHAVASLIVRAAGVDPLHAMEWMIAASLVLLAGTAVGLGLRLFRSVAAGVMIGLLALCGGNLLGPLIWLGRYFRYGAEAFYSSPDDAFGAFIYGGQVGARLYGPNFPFFFNITSRPVALVLVLVTAFSLRGALRRGDWNGMFYFVVSLALCTAFSPIMGLAAGPALIAAVVWLRLRRRSEIDGLKALQVFTGVGLGLLLALPTYLRMFTLSQGGTRFVLFSGVGVRLIMAALIGAVPLALMAKIGAARAHPDERDYLGVLQLTAYLLLVMGVPFQLPVDNSCNLYQAAIVLLAIPAAGVVMRKATPAEARLRPAALATALLLVLPNGVLSAHAYTGRSAVPLAFEGRRLLRLPRDGDLAAVYDWIDSSTRGRAVIIEDPAESMAFQGNAPELPAFTRCSLFIGYPDYMVEPYADAPQRRAIAQSLGHGRPLNAAQQQYLVNLDRYYLVVCRHMDQRERADRLIAAYGEPLMRRGDVAVFGLGSREANGGL